MNDLSWWEMVCRAKKSTGIKQKLRPIKQSRCLARIRGDTSGNRWEGKRTWNQSPGNGKEAIQGFRLRGWHLNCMSGQPRMWPALDCWFPREPETCTPVTGFKFSATFLCCPAKQLSSVHLGYVTLVMLMASFILLLVYAKLGNKITKVVEVIFK